MTIPTLSELLESIKSDLKNKLGITDSLIGKTVLNAFAIVQAAKMKIFYLLISFIYDNIFVDTASSESVGGTLERFGLIKLGRLPNPATSGEYKIAVTGTIGATILAGTTYKSLDASSNPNHIFVVDVAVVLTTSPQDIDIRSLDLGSDSRLEIDDQLQLTAPISNIDSFSSVSSVEVIPVDEEDIESYREKVILAYQQEPQGGAKTDYRLWSADASGVRFVYPYVKDGAAGQIDLYIEAFAIDSTDGNGTPTVAILTEVEDVVNFDPDVSKPLNSRGRRPMLSEVNYLSIITIPVDIEVVDLSDVSYLTAIKEAIRTFLLDIRPFIDGADNPNNQQINKLYESDIVNIVRDVIGGANTFSEIIMEVNSVVYSLYEFTGGDIPYINTVT